MCSNVDLIAYCGLFCGDCLMSKGNIAELAYTLKSRIDNVDIARIFQGLIMLEESQAFETRLV